MPNLQQIIAENENTINEVVQNIREEAYKDGFHAQSLLGYEGQSDRYMMPARLKLESMRLLLIEGFMEMVREKIGMVDIAIKSIDEREGLDSYFGGQKLILNRLLSELGSINEIK